MRSVCVCICCFSMQQSIFKLSHGSHVMYTFLLSLPSPSFFLLSSLFTSLLPSLPPSLSPSLLSPSSPPLPSSPLFPSPSPPFPSPPPHPSSPPHLQRNGLDSEHTILLSSLQAEERALREGREGNEETEQDIDTHKEQIAAR